MDCPERKVKKGDVFECTASIAGQSLRLKVTQTDDKGGVHFVPEQAIIDVAKGESAAEGAIQDSRNVTAKVTCGDRPVLIEDVGSSFNCQATFADGSHRTVKVTVKDVDGAVDFELV